MTEKIIEGIKYLLEEETLTAEVIKNPNGYRGNIIIPETIVFNEVTYRVTSVGKQAFGNCFSLTSVVIPNSVVKIGDSAFEGCSSLVSIFIPNSVIKLGDEECLYDGCFTIFRGCVNLRRIYIPYGTKQKFAKLLSRSYRDLLVEIEES